MKRNLIMHVHLTFYILILVFVHLIFISICDAKTIMYDTKYTGIKIKSLEIYGFQMCIQACLRSSKCKVLNWERTYLTCHLLKETVDAEFLPEVGTRSVNISFWQEKFNGVCDVNTCTGGSTCIPLQSGRAYCLQPYVRSKAGCTSVGYDLDDNKVICYKAYKDLQKTWYAAKDFCRSEKGDLVKLDTAHKALHLAKIVYKNINEKIYIGLNDDTVEGEWEWADGSKISYSNWRIGGGQPNNKDGGYRGKSANCVGIRKDDGQWTDEYCNKPLGFICERKDVLMN